MLHCDQCKQNDATIFLTQIVEGEITKAALCATCGEPFVQAAAESPQVRDYLQRHRVDVFAEVADRDARYTKEAFWFVRDGVHQAVRSRAGGSRHVTANELLETLRILALERYGTNAREQLRSWGVTRCEDFGEIVFALIDNGVFGKRPEDRKEDFENGYDFATAFQARRSEA
jgi:uncharacterized repeat protein (TIGR04138 family)